MANVLRCTLIAGALLAAGCAQPLDHRKTPPPDVSQSGGDSSGDEDLESDGYSGDGRIDGDSRDGDGRLPTDMVPTGDAASGDGALPDGDGLSAGDAFSAGDARVGVGDDILPVGDANTCGNGTCEPAETATSCPSDCEVCGNGSCFAPRETRDTCPLDCAVCGDGVCSSTESWATCPAECPAQCPQDCTNLIYTACSCSSWDPCGWKGDGYCDSYCADNFPGDHFDDPIDCAPPPTRMFTIRARFVCSSLGDAAYNINYGDAAGYSSDTHQGLGTWFVTSNQPPVWAAATPEGADPGAFVRGCIEAGSGTVWVQKVFEILDSTTGQVLVADDCGPASTGCNFGTPSIQYTW